MSSLQSVARDAEVLRLAAGRASASVAEMASAVGDVARIAEHADVVSKAASEDARVGNEAVSQTLEGMKEITDAMENVARVITELEGRSREIGKVVELIDDIADQTNLLALNAAIEAARAGDAGRGFAVVADEVRKLAERATTATREIVELIGHVQQGTSDAVRTARDGAAESRRGAGLVEQAGNALRRILESVPQWSQLLSEIAASSHRQSLASDEVSRVVAEMHALAQQVTRAVEAQAAASRTIRGATLDLNERMAEAAASMKEQAQGGQQVRSSIEDINAIASEVKKATREQAEGSRLIVQAIERMNRMTREVALAAAGQKQTGELVSRAMTNILQVSRENLDSVAEASSATSALARQAEELARLISTFRTS
jgi:methyl-accepting chemotaxis protein